MRAANVAAQSQNDPLEERQRRGTVEKNNLVKLIETEDLPFLETKYIKRGETHGLFILVGIGEVSQTNFALKPGENCIFFNHTMVKRMLSEYRDTFKHHPFARSVFQHLADKDPRQIRPLLMIRIEILLEKSFEPHMIHQTLSVYSENVHLMLRDVPAPLRERALQKVRVCAQCHCMSFKMDCCSRCKAVSYCNATCQTRHWNAEHATRCKSRCAP